MSFIVPFLRKQFAFWRIFLYFLAFTALYARLVAQFFFSNFSLPTGVGVLSNAVLFADTIFFVGGIFFLIYFMLFANAAINIFTAVTYLTGSIYLDEDMTMSDVEVLYMFYPTAKMIDVIYGVLLIALAAYAIFTRFQLSGFKRRGPFLFILMYVLNLVIGLLYGISIMFTFETGLLGFISFVPSIITSVVMIFVNVVYFRKREELFVY